MSDVDLFDWSSGLPDDFNALITDAHWGYDLESSFPNAMKLFLDMKSDDPEIGENGEYTLKVGAGNGWETTGTGEVATREDGNERKLFNVNSGVAKFYANAVQCDGAEEFLRKRAANEGIDTRHAKMLVNTAWHFKLQKVSYGGDIGDRDVLFPEKFLGEGTNIIDIVNGGGGGGSGGGGSAAKATGPVKKAPAPAKAAAPVQKAAKKAAPAPAVNAVAFGEGHALWDPLYNLAMECDDAESFVNRAFDEIVGVTEDEEVVGLLLDETNKGGPVWAKAVADYEAAN